MEYTTLGRTGLKVSVAGLGCGGNSRLGRSAGLSVEQSAAIVRRAIDLGVNILDTAEAYGTEDVVGTALQGLDRTRIVISTKSRIRNSDGWSSGADVVASLEASLKRLQTDYVDIFHLHAVDPEGYDHAMKEIVPAVLREKEKGKFRHLGVTETGPRDPRHLMLSRALADDCWEVVMLAFHMMNQNARETIFPHTRARGIGTLLMFVVRNIFSQPAYLARTVAELAQEGMVPASLAAADNPLGFLVHEGGARSVTDAAYRFARHQPGADVVLFGTGRIDHLEANVASILRPPLPETDVARLHELFGALEGVGLDLPDRRRG